MGKNGTLSSESSEELILESLLVCDPATPLLDYFPEKDSHRLITRQQRTFATAWFQAAQQGPMGNGQAPQSMDTVKTAQGAIHTHQQ